MAVITISREFASVGDDFGARVAQALGYHVVDRRFIVDVLDEYGMIDFEQEYDSRPGFWESFGREQARRSEMVGMLNQVVQAVARHGNVVILGRSGFAILADFPNALHVRLHAPPATRIANVQKREGLSREQAEAVVSEGDRIRSTFVEKFYGVPWDNLRAFDVTVNAGKVPPEAALAMVIELAKHFITRAPDPEPVATAVEVDPVLADAVMKRLGCNEVHA